MIEDGKPQRLTHVERLEDIPKISIEGREEQPLLFLHLFENNEGPADKLTLDTNYGVDGGLPLTAKLQLIDIAMEELKTLRELILRREQPS